MATWYLAKIRYQKEDEAGSLKIISEQYLFDAVSYTEAEAKLHTHIASNTPDFQLITLIKMRLSDVLIQENTEEVWYKVKVNYLEFDEKTQKDKKTPHFYLINAVSIETVCAEIKVILGNLNDYEIRDIQTSDILEIIPHVPENELLKHGNFKPVAELSA